jgi:hypothetical protein
MVPEEHYATAILDKKELSIFEQDISDSKMSLSISKYLEGGDNIAVHINLNGEQKLNAFKRELKIGSLQRWNKNFSFR